ncbi:MAG: hypothetical protein KAH01_02720 [Caldisericia bacterium]|nr:hypothetical protein [Caldisericia bacterium]
MNKKLNSLIDLKLLLRFILGSLTSIPVGILFREMYVLPLKSSGTELVNISTTMIFFWTIVGVGIGFVIGFYIISFLVESIAGLINQIKLYIHGLFSKKSFVIDSSTVLDGRIEHLVKMGLFDSIFYISSITYDELERLAKVSSIYARRVEKGRAVIESLKKLLGKKLKQVYFTIPPRTIREHILKLAMNTHSSIITLDSSLTDEAREKKIDVININELALVFRVQLTAGESFSVKLVRAGKEKKQAVGYLDDGMMAIIEDASNYINKTIEAECVSVLQSTSGKIVFGKFIRESKT